MTLNGALVGMVVGAVTVIVWKNFLLKQVSTKLFQVSHLHLSALVVSLLGKAPNANVTSRFEQAEEIYARDMK
jgi:sodium/proline symporter